MSRKHVLQLPREFRGIWVAEEWEESNDFYLRVLLPIKRHAMLSGNLVLLDKRYRLLSTLMRINAILLCFRTTPRNKIGGPGGVATQLGISRNDIYETLNKAGLSTDDLRLPDATPLRLLRKSFRFGPIIDEFERLANAIQAKKQLRIPTAPR
jgi:hypothetical protein